ncbi:hypothetical protein CGCS363_v006201 [Colletotrichum siamense]|uniref:uncharacterized protein n=1 Tax=Colletotrichum siamense TaxID=690259 RepID=UPI001872E5E5|nr:uncharacterized protein CGCS363_v006201 [Colletotrichum siamense]KAF5500103.1 hypothetical protein CGCS363_v006201 [Colletotrichum siamense]
MSSLNLALTWFRRCLDNHQRCKTLTRLNPQWMPTRLVDIGLEDTHQWRLIETRRELQAGNPSPYMTLSYRWGSHPTILLKSSTLESFHSGNPIEQLPLTFRDAIRVVRHFGMRYLWIDSLCIIQDCVADWKAEAPMMRDVYANSICNIAASASFDPDDGLFVGRDPTEIGPWVVESTLTAGALEKHFIIDIEYWDSRLEKGSLHDRGWVFQELSLAPRVLYFTRDQLMWACTETHGCEAFPDGMFSTPPKFDIEKAFQAEFAKFETGDLSSASGVWMDLIYDYTRCKLTKPEDRLYAVAGIAKLFQQMTGDRYLAGLWQKDLLHQLGWSAHFPAPKLVESYRAPSWSWASTDGMVNPNPLFNMESFVEIIDVDVQSRGVDVTLDAAHGYLKLRCPLFTASYFRATKDEQLILELRGISAQLLTNCNYMQDTQEDQSLVGNGTVDFIVYGHGGDPIVSFIACIVVERTRQAEDEFKRIGLLEIRGTENVTIAMDIVGSGKAGNKVITLV